MASVAALLAPVVHAQEEMDPLAPTESASAGSAGADTLTNEHLDAIIKRFDRNGDGRLDENEKEAAKAAMEKEGMMATKPIKPEKLDREEQRKKFIKRFDKNGDGKLDEKEREAAAEELRKRKAKGMPFPAAADVDFPAEIIKRFDKDGDGRLDETEQAEARAAFKARLESMPRVMERFDADHDGKLSDQEFAAAREEMRKRAAKAREQ